MAAFYNFHRKLMEQDPPTNAATCLTERDPNQNPNTICTPICVHICPYVCTTTQPPQPPPPTADYFLPPPQKHHHSPLSLPLKISLVILVLTFSLFLLYTLYKFYTVWYRSRTRRHPPPPPPPENQENLDEFLDHDVLDHPIWYIRTIGLQPSVISAITVVKYNKTDGVVEGTDCSVCLSDFQEDETLRLLPKCNHAFHISCIDTWLRSHTNCPLCRAGIVKNATNSGSSDRNSDDSGRIEETQMAISIPDEVDGEERQREDDFQGSELRIGVVDEEDLSSDNNNNNNNKGEMIGGGGSSDFLIIRRSVSLNDYADFRIRSGVNNNNYYSDRHEVQIQPIESDYNCFRERD